MTKRLRLVCLITSIALLVSVLAGTGAYVIVNHINSNATTTGTSSMENIYNKDGTVNSKAVYYLLKTVGYYGHENDTGTYTAHNIAGRSSSGSDATVIFPMGYYVSKSGTMDTTKPIYWQAVYLSNGYLTIWMNNNYTYDYFNNGTSTSSGWGNGTLYDTYSNYSKSTIRDITNNIYTVLSGKLTKFSDFVQSPSEAGATWQQTEKEDVYTISTSYYDHHNNLYYSSTSSYGGSYTGWAHSNWNNTNQPSNDKFWIPSSAEVFNNVTGSSNKSVENGLWGLTAADRGFKSINSSETAGNSQTTIEGNNSTSYCWLRSGSL